MVPLPLVHVDQEAPEQVPGNSNRERVCDSADRLDTSFPYIEVIYVRVAANYQELLNPEGRSVRGHCVHHVHGELLAVQAKTFQSVWPLLQRL